MRGFLARRQNRCGWCKIRKVSENDPEELCQSSFTSVNSFVVMNIKVGTSRVF